MAELLQERPELREHGGAGEGRLVPGKGLLAQVTVK